MTIETRTTDEIGSAGAAHYLDSVRSILPGIRDRAASAEELGQMHPDTVRELDEIGVFRGLQPRQWDGLELDPGTFFESVALVASACGSAGWVAGVLGVHPWEVGLLSEQAQREVWGKNPRSRLSSSYAPTGTVVEVAGGFRLSGQWRFSSGADICDWAILGGILDGETSADLRSFVVSRADYEIDQGSWKVAGLAGTGSKTLHVHDAFVPEYRSHKIADVNRGIVPGWEVNSSPLYRLPWMSGIFAYGIAAVTIGAATGALDAFVEQSLARVNVYGGPPPSEQANVQTRLAHALEEVEDCHARMRQTWAELGAFLRENEGLVPAGVQARTRYEASRTISRCLHAVLDVFEVAGGGAMDLANPVQRFLRDLLAMRTHPMGALESAAATYARSRFRGTISQ